MSIKLVCRKANEKSSIESDVSQLEQEGYFFKTVIPIIFDPKFADMCVILTK